jgi:oxepin-CoA hydrolase / 3-oxo-5,6-dehydrosuberyl-CoA semialdehyde dehydrogenase
MFPTILLFLPKPKKTISMKFQSYAQGQWVEGVDSGIEVFNAVNGDLLGSISSKGLDFKGMLEYGRTVGGSKLRKMTFHERGRMLKELALHLSSVKDKFYALSYATGATKVDSWIDIEGGIGNLFVYASKGRRELPNETFLLDGNQEAISKGGTFIGHHICVPMEGVAVHINAFNFPCWGMLEKIAVNFLAGVPAIVKPATATAYLTELMVKEIIASKILPEGALQLICGSAGDILDHVTCQDVVTFTGSAHTGKMLKAHPNIIDNSVRFNMEADSLNCSILGLDAKPGTAEFDLFIKEVAREMTVKAGQKCTAIRRTIVPENYLNEVADALKKRLATTTIGDPQMEGVRMGALAGRDQLQDVMAQVNKLKGVCEQVYGGDSFELMGGNKEKGAFMSPTLLYCQDPFNTKEPHEIEAFGPVSTLMPYKTTDEAIELAKMGKGSLVGSVFTADDNFASEIFLGSACMHGRMVFINESSAKESTGHGSPMPHLVHGGPGRAGGGEEMGGIRGVYHYMQRTAIQGSPTTIMNISNRYMIGAKQQEDVVHPFRKYFEDLNVGDTEVTHKHTVTDADIVNFANVSGDNFYAHMDATSLEGTIFENRVAHGYFVLSKAAGLFVSPKKGPVLLNYGIDECRFTKPVYPGMTIGVRLTVKEKVEQEKKSEDDIAKGIVKFLVDVYDEEGETVALATILTMVKKRNQE